MGPVGYGFFGNQVGNDLFFGRHPNFIGGFGHRHHHHYFPLMAPYYFPYYMPSYPLFDDYDASAYQQQLVPQQTQPVAAADPKPSNDRYVDRSFIEQPTLPQPQARPDPAQEQEPTVLVFRDGHKQEVRNYAIVGQMLWDFGAKGTHKIPLSDLDLDTTRKLNDDRGVEFVLPKG